MKNLLLLSVLTLGLCVLAQEPIVAIEMPEYNILYRGYPNKIIPAVYNNGEGTIFLEGKGVSISKDENGERFTVKVTGSGRAALISVYLINGNDTTFLRKVNYRVSNLPDPAMYWGGAKEGGKANIREDKLFAKYGPEIPLAAQFTVVSWELSVDSSVVMSNGNNLHEAEEILKKIEKPTKASFKIKYIGVDGITRTCNSFWLIDPWDETDEPNGVIKCGG